jgi:hypothetical protein
MFSQPQVNGLDKCMRFYPHDADSGGFFVTVLRKTSEFERISKPAENRPKDLREAPYIPMKEAAPDVLEYLTETFGLDSGFPRDQLFVRDEKSVKNICYISREISEWIAAHGSLVFRTISCGCPIFVWKGVGPGRQVDAPYPAIEGLKVVMEYAKKRVFNVTAGDMKKLLIAGHQAVPHRELDETTVVGLKEVEPNGCILCVPETVFVYPGMTFKGSVCVYLRKDLLPVELNKLFLAYPELATAGELEAAKASDGE